MEANYEKMLQDSNRIKNYIKGDIANLHDGVLTKKENEKKWSALEVIEHLNKVYDIYLDNFKKAISEAKELNDTETTQMKRTILGKLSIYVNKPKRKKRRFKMKTFDFFTPAVAPDQLHDIIDTYLKNKETFNELIKEARTKDLTNVKVPTALGQKVKFYIPECFEFLIAHEERHMVQIAEAVETR